MDELETSTFSHARSESAYKVPTLPVFDLDSYRDKTYLTHNLHPYPAKFVPQIPRAIIEKFSREGGTVFDPFSGSGTSLAEALLAGRSAIGSDLHPLAAFISRAKTKRLTPRKLDLLRAFAEKFASKYETGVSHKSGLAIPSFRNQRKWFTEQAELELAAIKHEVSRIDDADIRRLLTVCFSAIIVKASNQESDTRWKAIDKGFKKGDAIRFFVEKLRNAASRIEGFSKLVSPALTVTIFNKNSKELSMVRENTADLLVTSPPYMNSYDYYLYHKLRTYWLELDHYAVQEQEIGSRNKHSDHGLGLESYASEMLATMREARRILKRKAFAAYVIGDSILKAKLIRMDRVYEKIAAEAGFKHVDTFSYDQRSYTKAFVGNYKTKPKKTHIILLQN